MTDAYELLQPLRSGLVRIAATPQEGVCSICHSSSGPGFSSCFQCAQASYLHPPQVLPVTMSIAGGLVHHHLRFYKDDSREDVRERLSMRLAALLAVFMAHHQGCIGDWDVATCVPSTTRVAMETVVSKLQIFQGRYERLLAARPDAAGRRLDATQFEVSAATQGRRVLLLDDSFVSGAKMFSAFAALRTAGAELVGPVVLGRHAQRSWEPTAKLLEWLELRPWDETRCCRCKGEYQDEGRLF